MSDTLKLKMTVVEIRRMPGIKVRSDKCCKPALPDNSSNVEVVLQGSTPKDVRQFVLVFNKDDPRMYDYQIGQTVDLDLTPKPLLAMKAKS